MPRSRRTPIDAAGTAARLDSLMVAVRHEAEGAEADPFDDAMLAAVAGVVEVLKAEAGALANIKAEAAKAARRSARSE